MNKLLILILAISHLTAGKIPFKNCGKDKAWSYDRKQCEYIDYSINPELFKLVKGVFIEDKNFDINKHKKPITLQALKSLNNLKKCSNKSLMCKINKNLNKRKENGQR